jgi:hypothetical protein
MTHDAAVAAQVDAAAALLALPLGAERRAAVIVAMTRLAAFASDLAALDLSADIPGLDEPLP